VSDEQILQPLDEDCEYLFGCDGEYLFISRNGVRIARRGPQPQKHKRWTVLEPGFQVFEKGNEITIGFDPPRLAS
jgi:hypothetical protein